MPRYRWQTCTDRPSWEILSDEGKIAEAFTQSNAKKVCAALNAWDNPQPNPEHNSHTTGQ